VHVPIRSSTHINPVKNTSVHITIVSKTHLFQVMKIIKSIPQFVIHNNYRQIKYNNILYGVNKGVATYICT